MVNVVEEAALYAQISYMSKKGHFGLWAFFATLLRLSIFLKVKPSHTSPQKLILNTRIGKGAQIEMSSL
jgi:hypothetical protein